MTQTDVLILGAGAAGLFCAAHTARRGRRTLVLEHAASPGKKILISGGGRCNFTNLHAAPENFLSANPHFAKSALARYTPLDFLALVEQHRIPWHEKTLGQLFCDRSAHDILNLLLAECAAANARIQLSTRILSVIDLSSRSPHPCQRSAAKGNGTCFCTCFCSRPVPSSKPQPAPSKPPPSSSPPEASPSPSSAQPLSVTI
jgi:predicted flavoprotein YhiN